MIFLLLGMTAGIALMLLVVQFYHGHRREVYLLYGRTWTFIAGLGATMVLWCVIGMISQFAGASGSIIAMLLCISPTFWLAFSAMFLVLPPTWLREFEKERSPFEIMLAINNAQVMLRKYPRAFRKTIRQREGWELWLLTLGGWLELSEGGLESPNRQALREALVAPK